jgi:hypothetical protein
MLRITTIALLLAINVDLYSGGKYTHAAQQMAVSILHHFRVI